MRAIQLSRFGGPEVLEMVEIQPPTPGAGQILVRIHAAGVNFADTLMRQDRYAMTPPLPSIPGSEYSGTVEAVGPDVSGIVVGERVAAAAFAAGAHFGGYAEYAVIDANYAVPIPGELNFEEATALMVQGLTALHLVRQAPPAGKSILVNAAAGGVGSLLVQLAKRAGAKAIIAAASTPDKRDFARSLGADFVVDYTQPDWAETVRNHVPGGPDIIYESVGGDVTKASLRALAPLGRIVIYGALNIQAFQLGVPELLSLIFNNQSLSGMALVPLLTPENLAGDLRELFDLAVKGELKVTVGGSFPLANAGDAHRAIETRATTGKVVLLA
ncbi:quinone oxidoreductase family protein [Bosea vaviloviae]|uniref:NADPH:quinone oxidoreductase n=1 Tax=Bosea vaviloviae TaxID=1526658 RepID=A0A0N1F479_9HYPH|nr:zinc-binding dehydrogenase [Bosea vaviloviae]KPH80978.1 NADPH:quinone oxidoreductase [Bosea vaviloviae]